MTELTVRPAEAADLPALADVAERTVAELREQKGGREWWAAEARREPVASSLAADMEADDRLLVTGLVLDAVVGYAVAALKPVRDGVVAEVTDLYVEPEARGVGLGAALLAALTDWAVARGATGVESMALPGDRATKNFFEAHGLVTRRLVVHRSL